MVWPAFAVTYSIFDAIDHYAAGLFWCSNRGLAEKQDHPDALFT